MSAVATEQFGVRRPEGAPVSDDHQLHLALVDVDQHCGAPLCVHEEDDGEESHLKFRAGPDERAANRLHQTVPAELEVQDVVVLIRLRTETWLNQTHRERFMF